MRSNSSFFLRWGSLSFLAAALILAVVQLTAYSRARSNYPQGMRIAGIPVGGLTQPQAAERLLTVYTAPIEIRYAESSIQIAPAAIGFQINTEAMLAAADLQRTSQPFWNGYWDYLWNTRASISDVPLVAEFSADRLRAYLSQEVAPRYDQPAAPAQPVPGQTSFAPGAPGLTLDVESALPLIEDALRSPTNRVVAISASRTGPGRPSLENLKILIKQIVDLTPFDGVMGFYMLDLQTGQELHFGYDQNNEIGVQPDIAFTASSTIKIPVLVSTLKNLGPSLSEENDALALEMITKSENPATDALMNRIGAERGPLVVTQEMQALGISNTFIGGYFYDGAPLLQRFDTPANQRSDVITNPDAYNQTTPSDMGSLLADIYQCAQSGGGGLTALYPEQITQQSCQTMLEYLKRDRIGVLIEAGLPEGTQIAHKHGWISGVDGIIQNISDAAIVYTPGGNYVLVIYTYHPVQAVWEPVSGMIANISQAVYNYFNLPTQ